MGSAGRYKIRNVSFTTRRPADHRDGDAGHGGCLPAPLLPGPPVNLDGALRELLADANYALGWLDGAVLRLPTSCRQRLTYVECLPGKSLLVRWLKVLVKVLSGIVGRKKSVYTLSRQAATGSAGGKR